MSFFSKNHGVKIGASTDQKTQMKNFIEFHKDKIFSNSHDFLNGLNSKVKSGYLDKLAELIFESLCKNHSQIVLDIYFPLGKLTQATGHVSFIINEAKNLIIDAAKKVGLHPQMVMEQVLVYTP